jgi:hypothetical protein
MKFTTHPEMCPEIHPETHPETALNSETRASNIKASS